MEQRDNFMPPALLNSQFDTLEEPQDAIVVDIELSPDEIVKIILKHLTLIAIGYSSDGCDLNLIKLKGDRKTILVELIPELTPTSRR